MTTFKSQLTVEEQGYFDGFIYHFQDASACRMHEYDEYLKGFYRGVHDWSHDIEPSVLWVQEERT